MSQQIAIVSIILWSYDRHMTVRENISTNQQSCGSLKAASLQISDTRLRWVFVIVVLISVHCITTATKCVLEQGDNYAVTFSRVSNWAREGN